MIISTVRIVTDNVKAALLRLQERVGNLKPAMDQIGQLYERSVLENFAAEQSPDGVPWPKLSAVTLMLGIAGRKGFAKGKGKAMKGKGYLNSKGTGYLQNKKLLFSTGALMSRIHYQADSKSVAVGTAGIPYAAIHQFGGMAGRGGKVRIPARPWLAVNNGGNLELAQKDRLMLHEVIKKYLLS